MASKKPMGAMSMRDGSRRKGYSIPPRPSRKTLDAVIEEVLEDCFGEDEELAAWTEHLTEELDIPFQALLVPDSARRNAPPRPVEVYDVIEGEDGAPIAEVKLSDGTEVPVRFRDLIPLDAAEDTALLMYAYRDWVQGHDFDEDDFDEDIEEEDDDWDDDDDLALEDDDDVLDDDDLDDFPVLDDGVAFDDEDDEDDFENDLDEDDDDDFSSAPPKPVAKAKTTKTATNKSTPKKKTTKTAAPKKSTASKSTKPAGTRKKTTAKNTKN